MPSFFLGNALRKVLGWCAAWVLRTSEQPLPRTLPPGQEGNRGQGTRAWTLRRDSVSWAMRESFCEPGKGKKDAWELKTPTLRDTECVCAYVQTKAVLPKRCLGVSFFPNPNALGRFVLVLFVCFCFLPCFATDLVVEGASSNSFFQAALLLFFVVDPVVLAVFCWLVLCFVARNVSMWCCNVSGRSKTEAKNGCHVKVKWFLCIGWQSCFVTGSSCIQSK